MLPGSAARPTSEFSKVAFQQLIVHISASQVTEAIILNYLVYGLFFNLSKLLSLKTHLPHSIHL